MKGTPASPQCGFSRAVVQILDVHGVSPDQMTTYNCLEDPELREGIKEFSYVIPFVNLGGEGGGGRGLREGRRGWCASVRRVWTSADALWLPPVSSVPPVRLVWPVSFAFALRLCIASIPQTATGRRSPRSTSRASSLAVATSSSACTSLVSSRSSSSRRALSPQRSRRLRLSRPSRGVVWASGWRRSNRNDLYMGERREERTPRRGYLSRLSVCSSKHLQSLSFSFSQAFP